MSNTETIELETERGYTEEEMVQVIKLLPATARKTFGHTVEGIWFHQVGEYRFQCKNKGTNELYYLVSYPQNQ